MLESKCQQQNITFAIRHLYFKIFHIDFYLAFNKPKKTSVIYAENIGLTKVKKQT